MTPLLHCCGRARSHRPGTLQAMLELIPDRAAVCSDKSTTLYVLVRITPEPPVVSPRRPELNLTLVLDRSGSMQGEKIRLLRQAAAEVVQSLGRYDILSIVLFSDQVEVMVDRARIYDFDGLLRRLESIEAHGATALFEAWQTGSSAALAEAQKTRLNRIILLTDGEANRGETKSGVISWYVRKVAEQGVQTTTMGFGTDYNEELLRSIASYGEGNHFYVETPEQLAQCFNMELSGLLTTQGTQVRLECEALAADARLEWMAKVETNAQGEVKLADLVLDQPLSQLLAIHLPPQLSLESRVRASLTYHSPTEGCRLSMEAELTLPVVASAQRQSMPVNQQVEAQVAVALASRARGQAIECLHAGEDAKALQILRQASDIPALSSDEREAIDDLFNTLNRGERSSGHKKAAVHEHSYIKGRVMHKPMD